MKKKLNTVYIVICLLASAIFYFSRQGYLEKKEVEENLEYASIYDNSQEYSGQITEFSSSKSRRETFLVKLSNGQKFLIYNFSFLQKGDSIYKAKGTDTLCIFTKEKEYKFAIRR